MFFFLVACFALFRLVCRLAEGHFLISLHLRVCMSSVTPLHQGYIHGRWGVNRSLFSPSIFDFTFHILNAFSFLVS